MARNVWSKILCSFLILSLVLPSLVSNKVSADEAANSTARSMINFFRSQVDDFKVDNITESELKVYGVFLSNFFLPWATQVDDLRDGANNPLSKVVSSKFFGSEDQSAKILEMNAKLHAGIIEGLGSSDRRFALYDTKDGANGGKPITGDQLLYKLTGEGDKYIYNSSGIAVYDLSNSVVRTVFQTLYALNPTYMFDENKGMRKVSELHLDGLGNVWGKTDKGDEFGKFVLVLPAALNPLTFQRELSDPLKLPVTNVFMMGAAKKVSGDILSGKPIGTPYYNGVTKGSGKMTLFGIHSPSTLLGRSNLIIANKNHARITPSAMDSFLTTTGGDRIPSSNLYAIASVDTSGMANDSVLKKIPNVNSEEKVKGIVHYFSESQVFRFDQLADDMYYFSNPKTGLVGGSSDWFEGKDTELLAKKKLFVSQFYDSNGNIESGVYNYYSSSYEVSPYARFLAEYKSKTTDTELNTYLANALNGGAEIPAESLERIKSFVTTGSFRPSEALADGEKILDVIGKDRTAMQYLFGKDKDTLSELLPDSTSVSKVALDSNKVWGLSKLFGWFVPYTYNAFALSEGDSIILDSSHMRKYEYGSGDSVSRPKPTNTAFINLDSDTFGYIPETTSDITSIYTLLNNFMSYVVIGMDSATTNGFTGTSSSDKFKTPWEEDFSYSTTIMNGVNSYAGIYWGYMNQLLQINKSSTDEDARWTSSDFKAQALPYIALKVSGSSLDLNNIMGSAGIVSSENKQMEEMQKDIVKKVYGLLSEGQNSYRDSLIKSSQDSWIIQTHRSITGSWVGNVLSVSAGGNSSYASIVGFINTPSLHDLPLTAWILKDYMYLYMFFLMLVGMFIFIMVIINVRGVKEGVGLFFIMAFVLILPQFLVGNVINFSNSISDQMYSGRFNYWAITQHQQSDKAIKSARSSGDDLQLAASMDASKYQNMYSTDAGVRVKWMAPKRGNTFDSLFSPDKVTDQLASNSRIFRWLFSSMLNQEEFVYNDPLATYIYRPYNAIAQETQNSFKVMSEGRVLSKTDMLSPINVYGNNSLNTRDYMFKMIKDNRPSVAYAGGQEDLIKAVAVLNPAASGTNQSEADARESYRFWGLTNSEITKSVFNGDVNSNPGIRVTSESDPNYVAYTLLTESPYSYFYNMFIQRYGGGTSSFKNTLLNADVFIANEETSYNRVNNELRDFLDLEGLFTYVVPYLHQGNMFVDEYVALNGSEVSGFSGTEPDPSDPNYEQFQQEQLQKENMKHVWQMYSPWVDQIYDLKVMGANARAGGKTITIEDALNPGAYDDAKRPMIFSPADMEAKDYSSSDLTDIELRIQNTLKTTYKDLMYLTNYIDFSDDVLVSAAAMVATFNFNREFSDKSFLGESTMLYPQNYELKNFNYDAFMRLIMLNATGESIMSEKDLYVTVLEKTSIFTGALLLLNDVLAVILIPTIKVLVLFLLLILCLVIAVSCMLSPPENIFKNIAHKLFLPAALFVGFTTIFAFVISLFMGEGLTSYVGGRTPNLGLTDPTTTLGLMALVSCVYLVALFFILKMLFTSLKVNLKVTALMSLGLLASMGGQVMKTATNGVKRALGKDAGSLNREMKEYYKNQNDSDRDALYAAKGAVSGESVSPITSVADNTKDSAVKDAELANHIDSLASADTPVTKRKTIHNRLIDFKYASKDAVQVVKNTPQHVKAGYDFTADATKAGYERTVSAAREAIDQTKDGYYGVRGSMSERKANNAEYELNKMMDRTGRVSDKGKMSYLNKMVTLDQKAKAGRAKAEMYDRLKR